MPDIIELGRAKKAQRPGVYDHVSDLDLGKAIKLKFPDAYQDFTEFVGPRAPTDLPPPESTQPQSGPVGKFMDKAWEQVNPEPVIRLGADLMAGASRTPEGAARTNQAVRAISQIPGNILKSQADQSDRANKAAGEGKYVQALAHRVGAKTPIIGPPLANAVEDIAEGRVAEGLGTGFGIALPGVAKLGNRALQSSKLGASARDAAARSYTRALNPANLRDTKMMGDVATAVHGKPDNATSGAAPGLKVTAPVALTRGGLQEKLQTRSADLGQQIETLQSAIPEGTITLPFADVASRVGQGLRDKFTITPQPPTVNGITSPPIPPSPTTMDAAGAISSGASELRNLKKKSVRPTVGPPPAPVTTQIPTTTTSPILGPNGQPITSTTYTTKVTQPPAPRGPRQIDYQVVRKVKQGLDAPLSDKGRFSPIVTSDAAPRVAGKENVANTLRTILNEATPEIAEVNKKYSVAKSATDAIDRTVEILASRKEPISQRLANALTASMLVGNGVGATGMVAKSAAAYTALNIHRLVRSTAWNTMSGATKAKLADLIESGDFVGVNGLLAAEGVGQVGKQITPPPSQRK